MRRALVGMAVAALSLAAMIPGSVARAQAQSGVPVTRLDRLLDLYVRDGLVYYAALRLERAALDQFVQSIADEPSGFNSWSPEATEAFWLNAYNALVLHTVIEHYPVRGNAPNYPPNSIRQIPGAFDERSHRVAGRAMTLDEIETRVLPTFCDPRVFLALGRGAVGSGRLRSEAYAASKLDAQLEAAVKEFATTPQHVTLDRLANEVRVSPIFGWREHDLVAAYADRGWADSGRTPIERAILAMIEPALFPSEHAFLEANSFTLRYQEFDWRLNDLTGGRP